MKNMKTIKAVAVLTSLSLVIVGLGFGCGVGYTVNGGGSSNSSTSTDDGTGGVTVGSGNVDGLVMKPGTATYGTAVYTSFYNSLMSKLNLDPGVPAQITNLNTEFNSQREALSDTGKATGINAPFVFAATALSAAGCLDRIAYERANPAMKLFFNDINLDGASTLITHTALKSVINRLARGLYGDNQAATEDTLLIADVRASMADDATDNANETRAAMLYICTSMAASTLGISQ